MPEIRRKPVNAYVDEAVDNKTGVCFRCEQIGIESILVPYIMPDGRRDDAYGRCPNCSSIFSKNITPHKTIEGPLGKVMGVGQPSFEVVKERRRVRRDNRREDLKQDIPKLANKNDTDLEIMVREGAIIVDVNDDYIREEQ